MIFEETDEFGNVRTSAPIEAVEQEFKAAQQTLFQLKIRQEEIERTKQELENVSIKQGQFAIGKRDLLEKLNRAVTNIERELYASQKLVEELTSTHDA